MSMLSLFRRSKIEKRSIAAFFLVVALALIVGSFAAWNLFRARGSHPNERPHARVNEPAPDFVLEKRGGGVGSNAALRGRIIVLEFWTSWCAACQNDIPALEEFQRKFGDKDVAVVAVHRTRTELQETAEEFLKRAEPSFTVLFDRTDEVYQTYVKGGRALPASFLIDRKGVVRSVFSGPFDEQRMGIEVEKYLRK